MKKIEIKCEVCGKAFERSAAEVKRNQKIGRRVYCSLACQGKVNIANFGDKINTDSSKLKKGSDRDEYSQFRVTMRLSKRSATKCGKRKLPREHNLTLEDLKQQWEKQGGICPYTGWKITFLETTGEKLPKTPDRASLDRIDSTKGYVKGNIQFVSLIAQYAKNGWDGSVVHKFAKAVVEHLQT